MMRKICLVLLAFAGISSWAFEEKNILVDPNFEGKATVFPGSIGAWYVDSGDLQRPQKVLAKEGPNGANAIRIDIPRGEVFRQGTIELVAGEKYRIGAYFRTSGIQTQNLTLRLWNTGWLKEIIAPEIPRNTNGQWVKIETEGILPPSSNGCYSFGVYAKQPKGTFDMACPYLIPLSEKALAGSKVTTAQSVKLERIIPVYPLLRKIDAAAPAMRFFIPNYLEKDFAAYELRVQTKMAGETEFSTPHSYGFDENRLVDARLGKLPLGEGTLKVSLAEKGADRPIAQNEYTIQVIQIPPKANLKRLNNMVSEIMTRPLANGEVQFHNPREGWVFIGLDKAYPNTKIYLDNAPLPVVYFRDGEPSDTMRLLKLGEHSLRIEGAPDKGTLLIRAVAQIMLYPIAVHEKLDINNFRYDRDFQRRYLWHAVNLFDCEQWLPKSEHALAIDREIQERGMKIVGSRGLWRLENIDQVDKMVAGILNNATYQRNWGITIDELSLTCNPAITKATADALWQMLDQEKRIYLWGCSVENGFFSSPIIHHELLSAGSNVSRSEGKIFLETYVGSKRTEAESDEYMQFIPLQLEIARKLAPDAAERMMMLMSGYTTPEVWCIHRHPSTDMKVVFDKFFHILATDPRMDGLYGMGCYSIGHTDEETTRWIGKLMRYYCVDGGTELLSKQYGFNYTPGHIQDGDFEKGFQYWKTEPAEKDSIKTMKINGFGGNGYEWRVGREGNLGDTVTMFTRSSRKPNKLSQVATGLTPGKLYCLSFLSIDYDDYLKPNNKTLPYCFDAVISNAEIIPEVTSTRLCPTSWYGTGDYKPGTPQRAIRRIVFRAKKNTAKITFTDWKSDTEPGGPAGVRRVFNWIGLRPYFQE